MSRSRLEAFSDGVLAIILTIMVLELKVPHGSELGDLVPLLPVFLSYVMSFTYVGIYWNNHHHLMHTVRVVGGGIMWANLHLLFWLSLIPVVTGWAGEHPWAHWPAALYGVVLFMAGIAWLILQKAIIARNGPDSALAQALGRHDFKGNVSLALYATAIGVAFVRSWLAEAIYAIVACIWLVPDRRIEARVVHESP
jgi:uncharacterized membrane protein